MDGVLNRLCLDTENAITYSDFGCNEFKPKPKGPFRAIQRKGSICEIWDVDVHFPSYGFRWICKGTQTATKELARFLNARWAERKE